MPTNLSTRKKVYNLTIENENEYFANGILVHNCDALQGAVQLLQVAPKGKKKEIPIEDEGFEYLRNTLIKKKKKKRPFVFGRSRKVDEVPFKETFR